MSKRAKGVRTKDVKAEGGMPLVVLEVGRAIMKAKSQPKDKAFPFLLTQISDSVLNRLMESFGKREEDEDAAEALTFLGIGVRSMLHGDKSKGGGFAATDKEMLEFINTVSPFIIHEAVRRRGCFEDMKMPSDPFSLDIGIWVTGPDHVKIAHLVAEMKQKRVPVPPYLQPPYLGQITSLLQSQSDETIH